jgi:DNA-binding transcriptional ArsR family regulator
MSDQEKTLPAAGSRTDGDLKPDFTFEQLQDELRRLWKRKRASKQPDEFSVSDYARTNGISKESARKDLKGLEKAGLVKKGPERRLEDRHVMTVYLIVGPGGA